MKLLICLALLPAAVFAVDAPKSLPESTVGHLSPPEKQQGVPLPERAKGAAGVWFVDLNGDGFDDLVVSNTKDYGVYLYNPVEKKNLQWFLGWTNVLREGTAGDANSIPSLVDAQGKNNGVWFADGAMWVRNTETAALPDKTRRIPFAELLKVPGPLPKTPEQSLEALHLKPGFTATLVAAEPLVQDPVFVDWDTKGRMWVVEMGDYPFAPGETTKDGSAGQGKVSDLQQGRIKILEDTNGDGVYDKATVFMDGLKHPTSLTMWKNGVIVAAIPDIFYAEDTDGDGKCDKKEVWFTGFTAGNPQHLVNGFSWGLDGHFYGSNGESGGEITSVKTGQKVSLGANDFQFSPKSLDFEIDAGRSQYGKWRDDYGNLFGNNNSVMAWHYYLPLSMLARNPSVAVKSVREVLNNEKQVFPVSPSVRRFNWADATNTLTSGCSPIPFRDDTFGADGKDVMFICEPANNLVHRELLNYDDITVSSSRHPDDKGSEFIASEDNWFRPSMARTGPDGALYVVDMYRLVLEHPEWIPAEITKGLDLRAGEDKGRIYRIAKTGVQRPAWPDFSNLEQAIQSSNGWVRDTAMRLMLDRRDVSPVPTLKKAVQTHANPAVQIQALWTLKGFEKLDAATVLSALNSPHTFVRVNALRCLADEVFVPGQLDDSVIDKLIHDPAPPVRFALALVSYRLPKAQRVRVITALAQQDGDDLRMITALRCSLPGIEADLGEETRKLIASKAKQSGKPVIKALPVITNNNPDRQQVVKKYAVAATLEGDAKHGHLLYSAVCSACHKLKSEGNEIGPDLGTVAGKPLDQVIESILDPNRAVEQRYSVQSVVTKDQKEHVGLILEENGNNITLRTGTAVELILLKDIKKRSSTNRSLMPDGLESLLKPQDVADVIAWIKLAK